jgi:hypothetical protein
VEADAVAVLLPRLGWRLPGNLLVSLRDLTVRIATQLQLADVAAARREAHTAYVREALGPHAGPDAVPAALGRLGDAFDRMWRQLLWENGNKEVLWRLAVDGVAMPGNSHMRAAPAYACGCGGYAGGHPPAVTPRLHHFWECPVAQAVREQVEVRLGAAVSRAQLWLALPPPQMQQCVWDVVVLAALGAVEVGRRFMCAELRRAAAAAVAAGAAAGGAPRVEPGPRLCDRAVVRAVADFWSRLRGFARLGVPRKGWDEVGAGPPVLRVVGGCWSDVRPFSETIASMF